MKGCTCVIPSDAEYRTAVSSKLARTSGPSANANAIDSASYAYLDHQKNVIINNTSINAFKGNKSRVSYTASKGALTGLMRSPAMQLAERGIRCNAVAPFGPP